MNSFACVRRPVLYDKMANRIAENCYIHTYKAMIFFEDARHWLEIKKFDQRIKKLYRLNKTDFYFTVSVSKLISSIIRSDLILNDFVLISQPDQNGFLAAIDDEDLYHCALQSRSSGETFKGIIQGRESQHIYLQIYRAWEMQTTDSFDIVFESNRTVYQLQHNALELIQIHQIFDILISNSQYFSQNMCSPLRIENIKPTILNQISQDDLNDKQIQAIHCIVSGKYNPTPYLLYGPPGL